MLSDLDLEWDVYEKNYKLIRIKHFSISKLKCREQFHYQLLITGLFDLLRVLITYTLRRPTWAERIKYFSYDNVHLE